MRVIEEWWGQKPEVEGFTRRKGENWRQHLDNFLRRFSLTGRSEVTAERESEVEYFFSCKMDNDQAEEKKWKIQQWGIKFVEWCQEGTELVWKLKGDGLCLSSHKSTWQQIEVGLTWKEVKSVVCSECEPGHSTVASHCVRELCVHCGPLNKAHWSLVY